jgi:hypothetical protein
LDLGRGVGRGGRGDDACGREPGVGRQCLEEIYSLLEVVYNLLGGLVVGVAVRFKCADAGSVFGPLVLPEGLVVTLVVFPVCAHVAKKIRLAERVYDGGDVGVGAGGIAVRVVGAVAAVGPVCTIS